MCTTCGCSAPEHHHDDDEHTSHAGHSHAGHSHDGHLHDGHSHDGHSHDGHSHDGHLHDGHSHDATHSHDGAHSHDDAHPQDTMVPLHRAVLEKNARHAERNRGWLAARRVVALNFVSSPGAGKTTLLERTIRDLRSRLDILVIEGDQATSHDADRIRAAGARAVQINTGTGCHLDAAMVARALPELDPPAGSLVAIENVGNLVCPALFDLGEEAKVLVASVTEGDDKPLKYPHMFHACEVVLLNKMDLLEHVRFDVNAFAECARRVRPGVAIVPVSATAAAVTTTTTPGAGLGAWYAWLEGRVARARSAAQGGQAR